MSIFYFQISEEGVIVEVFNHNMPRVWYESVTWEEYLSKSLTDVLEDTKLFEIKGKCFYYDTVRILDKTFIFFNQEVYLKTLYENALNYISEGVQVFDRNGYLVYANKSSEKLENYSFDNFKNKHLLDLYNLSEEYSTTLSVLRTGEPVINRCDRFITKEGKVLVTINSGFPLKNNGELLGACVFESDLSTIKNTENRLFNLEHFIRTDDLSLKQVRYTFKDIVHVSETMQQCIKYAKKASLSQANILIVGETGTGKELIAQSIHDYSKRCLKPFVDVNCGALPSNLVESLFFGTEKGAFTGSIDKKGLFEVAEGGTLFLDEVSAMDYDLQAKLLRVIQERRYQKVGGNKYHLCDVRIIASLNEDPEELIKSNRLRKDFYYRLANMIIELPPLRQRREDIELLSQFFLSKFSTEMGYDKLTLSPEVLNAFYKYHWSGNVRELEHVVNSAAHHMNESEKMLTLNHLPHYFLESGVSPIDTHSSTQNLNSALLTFEKQYVEKVLERFNGNITQTAKHLGISRQNLQYRIKKYNL